MRLGLNEFSTFRDENRETKFIWLSHNHSIKGFSKIFKDFGVERLTELTVSNSLYYMKLIVMTTIENIKDQAEELLEHATTNTCPIP